jgi:flagella basal body P-ring formation protein FlgA
MSLFNKFSNLTKLPMFAAQSALPALPVLLALLVLISPTLSKALADEKIITIRVRAQNNVLKDNIELGDIAIIENASVEEEAVFAHLILEEAPATDQELTWSAEELSRKLRPYQALIKRVTLKVPANTVIFRQAMTSSEKIKEQIIDTLKTMVPDKSWEIKITDVKLPSDILPKGFSIDTASIVAPVMLPRGDSQFEIQGTSKSVTAHVSYFTDCAIVKHSLRARSPLSPNDVTWKKRDVTRFKDIPIRQSELLNSLVRSALLPGAVITRQNLEREMVLKFGDEIELQAGEEGFSIKTKGVAQQNGYIGDVVRVRTLGAQKTLNGLVVSRGVVHVQY